MNRSLRFLIFSLLLSTTAFAYQPAEEDVEPPILILELPSPNLEPIEIATLTVDVQVLGNLATTTYDVTFYNPNDRQLEGDLWIPLADGQTMGRFALEIEGALREGVAVEKAKGRQTFEAIVRRNVDPALLEQTQGNNFRARVYPIPARGTKRVVYSVEESLPWEAQALRYQLPLYYGETIKDFSLRVEVINQTLQPTWEENGFSNLTFDQWNESYVAEHSATDFKANQTLRFRVPKPASWRQVYVSPTGQGDYFFMVQTVPEWQTVRKKTPKYITILWDASGSAADRDLKKELALLERYFNQNRDVLVELVVFRDVMEKVGTIAVQNGDMGELKETLNGIAYDGGTRGAFFNQVRWTGDEIWLFSDGLFTLGDPAELLKRPVYTVSSSPKADFNLLRSIATRGGGAYINLRQQSTEEAMSTLTSAPFQYINTRVKSGEVTDVYPANPQPLAQGQVFTLTGRTTSPEVALMLQFGEGRQVTSEQTLTVATNAANDRLPLARRWAYQKYAHLAMLGSHTEGSRISLAKAYTLVTPLTSLIVLETLEDYLEYEITPPAMWREEYMAAMRQKAKEAQETRRMHITNAVNLYQERIDWWNTTFVVRERNKEDSMNRTDSFGNEAAMEDSPVMEEVEIEEMAFSAPPSEDWGDEAEDALAAAAQRLEAPTLAGSAAGVSLSETTASAQVAIRAWNPDQPYLQTLKNTPAKKRYAKYLELRDGQAKTPSFFLDVAIYFHSIGEKATALRIVSNLAELELESDELLRILGYQYQQWEEYALAEVLMRKVLELREELPQSYRDLAQICALQGKYEEAAELYMEVIAELDDEQLSRFPNIRELCLYELNQLRAPGELETPEIPESVHETLPVDVRVVMTWNVSDVDIDLWLTDPYGERCGYSNRLTQQGSRYTSDYTGGGLGPEEILLKKAKAGEYEVIAHYYGSSAQRLLGPVTVQVAIYTNYGRPTQEVQELTLQLEDVEDDYLVGTFEIGG